MIDEGDCGAIGGMKIGRIVERLDTGNYCIRNMIC
jgi:hypothetical protein